MLGNLAEHKLHGLWRRIGSSVYCACDERLYQGDVPKSEADRNRFAAALDEIARLALLSLQTDHCEFCLGTGWVEDRNWEPEQWEMIQGRRRGAGLIRCGICWAGDEVKG